MKERKSVQTGCFFTYHQLLCITMYKQTKFQIYYVNLEGTYMTSEIQINGVEGDGQINCL